MKTIKRKNILDKRLKFLTSLLVIVILIVFITTTLNFGVGILEDNFVAKLSTHYNSSAQFMSLYGLLNFYLYTMAYVYLPNNKSVTGTTKNIKFFSIRLKKNSFIYILDSTITKDNPSFSMINDSDEDVIYGSDEESRKPLNRSRNDDDSD